MPVTVELFDNEPIVLLTFTLPYDGDSAAASKRVADLTQDMDGPIYRISDVAPLNLTWDVMQEGFSHHVNGEPGSMSDPKFIPIMVGGGSMSAVFARGLRSKEFGNLTIHLFETRGEALAFARTQIAAG